MATSQNGRKVFTEAPGGRLKWITGRVDPALVDLFDYYCERYNKEVEKINPDHSWGWANREIRGGGDISNHASGSAVDLNAPKHPLGVRGTFSSHQEKALKKILDDIDGILRHGHFYKGRIDSMHAELRNGASNSDVRKAMAKIKRGEGDSGGGSGSGGSHADGMLNRGDRGTAVQDLQKFMNRVFPAYSKLVTDGVFGPKTEAVVKEFQKRVGGLVVDGIVGPKTRAKLRDHGF